MVVKVLKAEEGQFVVSSGKTELTLNYFIHNGIVFNLPESLKKHRDTIWEQLFALVGHENLLDDDDD